jgi:hypothetical protein
LLPEEYGITVRAVNVLRRPERVAELVPKGQVLRGRAFVFGVAAYGRHKPHRGPVLKTQRDQVAEPAWQRVLVREKSIVGREG